MVDIPELIANKRKQQSADRLMQLQLSLAANNRVMETDSYRGLIQNLTKDLEDRVGEQATDKLDRHAFEALRFMTNQGANRTGKGG